MHMQAECKWQEKPRGKQRSEEKAVRDRKSEKKNPQKMEIRMLIWNQNTKTVITAYHEVKNKLFSII